MLSHTLIVCYFSYCLDLTRLRHLGFPLESELHPGTTVIYVDPDVGIKSRTKESSEDLANSSEFLCMDDFVPPHNASDLGKSDSLQQPALLPTKVEPLPIISDATKEDKQPIQNTENISIMEEDVEDISHQPYTQPESTVLIFSAGSPTSSEVSSSEPPEDLDISMNSCDDQVFATNFSVGGGTLDVNAQEFVPGNCSSLLPMRSAEQNSSSHLLIPPPISLSASAKEFIPSSPSSVTGKTTSSDIAVKENDSPERRRCARCKKLFFVDKDGVPTSKEKCLYHWGKVWHCGSDGSGSFSKKRNQYTIYK